MWEAKIPVERRPSLGENAETGMLKKEHGFTAGTSRSTEEERQVLKTQNRWPDLGLGLLLLTFPLTQPGKTTGPFWFFSPSHEKVEKETFQACARSMLFELHSADYVLD